MFGVFDIGLYPFLFPFFSYIILELCLYDWCFEKWKWNKIFEPDLIWIFYSWKDHVVQVVVMIFLTATYCSRIFFSMVLFLRQFTRQYNKFWSQCISLHVSIWLHLFVCFSCMSLYHVYKEIFDKGNEPKFILHSIVSKCVFHCFFDNSMMYILMYRFISYWVWCIHIPL